MSVKWWKRAGRALVNWYESNQSEVCHCVSRARDLGTVNIQCRRYVFVKWDYLQWSDRSFLKKLKLFQISPIFRLCAAAVASYVSLNFKVDLFLKHCLHNLVDSKLSADAIWCLLRLSWKIWWMYHFFESTKDFANTVLKTNGI